MRPRSHVEAVPPRPAAHPREGLRDPRQPRGDQRGPLRPGPFTHNHGRHPIAYNDHVKHPVDCADYHDHEQQPVTVADLLDAIDAARSVTDNGYRYDYAAFESLLNAATDDVKRSFYAVKGRLNEWHHQRHALAALSPEERAEYDRRTT